MKHGSSGFKGQCYRLRSGYSHSASTCMIEEPLWADGFQADGGKQRGAHAGNVKHGDHLRTLGGAMTAQCKVLHLLFSQSDYPKIVECHFIQSVCLCLLVCYHGRLPSGSREHQLIPGTTLWSRLTPSSLLFYLLVKWPLMTVYSTWWRTGTGLCLPPNQRWGITIPILTFWISRHMHSAAHTVSISIKDT